MIEVQNSVPNPEVSEAVLFPFDSHSIPFSTGLRLRLVQGKTPMVTGDDGMRALDVVLAAVESSRTGQTIQLPLEA